MNKLLTSLLLSVTLMSGAQAQKKENYYVKHVEFPQSATIEQKVDMAARLVPTPQQYAWQQMELTAFLHFGINTFTGREWGDGKEDPALFNPSELDAEQWVRTLRKPALNGASDCKTSRRFLPLANGYYQTFRGLFSLEKRTRRCSERTSCCL